MADNKEKKEWNNYPSGGNSINIQRKGTDKGSVKAFQKSLKKIQERWDNLGINYAKILE